MPNKLPLDPAGLPADPFELVRRWLDDAVGQGMRDPGAMALATAGADGRPSARMVLLRGLDEKGFRFHTNRGSLKGRQLAENPRAQLLFYWRELGRQIFVHGAVEELSDEESDAYFATRPRGARLGAIASEQGAVIKGREELVERWAAADAAYPGEDVPRPAYWGGYLVIPDAIEFWEAHELRLHDRYVYARLPGGGWRIDRLSP
jgi:pyridoxamine 5'-phosphate oxidase